MGAKRCALLFLWGGCAEGSFAGGGHLQIAPTLAELIAPQGTTYTSLLPPLMQSKRAFNHRLFIENGEIGEEKALSNAEFKKEIEAARTVARWMVQQDR